MWRRCLLSRTGCCGSRLPAPACGFHRLCLQREGQHRLGHRHRQMGGHNDHQGRPAAARHRVHPRRQVRDGRRRRRRHDPGDRHQDPSRSWTPCPPVPTRNCSRRMPPARSSMSPTRTTTPSPSSISRSATRLGDIQVGVEPEGMTHQPGRQDPDQHLRDHQHGAFHRHRDAPDRRQRAGRFAAALCRVQARRLRALGVLRDRRHGVDHRSRQARGHRQGHLRDSRPAARGDPAGRHRHHQGRQDRLRRARPGQPRRRGRRRDP